MADAFDMLGVRADFDLSREELDRAYLAAAERLHPDLAAGDDEAARRMADLNRARRVLENLETRADALLVRLGGPRAEQEKSLPAGFLAEVMQVREEVEAAVSGGGEGARAAWEGWSRGQRDEVVREVRELFGKLGSGADRGKALREIRVRLNAWRYIERLIEQLDPGR